MFGRGKNLIVKETAHRKNERAFCSAQYQGNSHIEVLRLKSGQRLNYGTMWLEQPNENERFEKDTVKQNKISPPIRSVY